VGQRRPRRALYHSALVVTVDDCRYTIEMTPIPRRCPAGRGVVVEGAVGSRHLGRMRVFRYEVRRWRDGIIPDLEFAVCSPVLVSSDPAIAQRVLQLVAGVPAPVWGRDELAAGEMWNSNSVVSWTLTAAGVVDAAGSAPGGGRAPGWDAGVAVARRALNGVTGERAELVESHE
jgi:hypothetical protein